MLTKIIPLYTLVRILYRTKPKYSMVTSGKDFDQTCFLSTTSWLAIFLEYSISQDLEQKGGIRAVKEANCTSSDKEGLCLSRVKREKRPQRSSRISPTTSTKTDF